MRITFFSFFLLFSFAVFSQSDNTNSPYTRYGYGQLADQTFTSQRGMGGIGYGLRNSQMINPLNPASYSAVDSMTFMLDFGLKGQVALLNDGGHGKARRYNAGLEYVALQIPLGKGLGMGLGIEPVSFVGYQFGDTTHVLNSIAYKTYFGTGGLTKIYSTLSYNLFNRLSLGINIGYMFGHIINNGSESYTSTTDAYTIAWPDSMIVKGLTYEAGLQYVQRLSKNSEVVFGAVYSPKITTNTRVRADVQRYDISTGAIVMMSDSIFYNTRDSVFQMPETYGIGVTYRKKDKLTLGADFQYQRWADAKFYDKTDTLANRMKINAGVEYIPNVRSNSLFSRIRYRAGGYFANSYIIDKNHSKYNEYGLSIGMGIPMVDRRSFFNMAFEYSRLTPQKPVSMSEQYFKLTVSCTFNELWFYKRKLQ